MKRPSLHIAMPCYDSVKIRTMISIVKLVKELTAAGLKFELEYDAISLRCLCKKYFNVKIPSEG